MKKLMSMLVVAAMCASCFGLMACGNNEQEAVTESETAVEEAATLDPVGMYQFESVAMEEGETVVSASVDDEWEGEVLTADYMTADVKDDGTIELKGAVEAKGTWMMDENGVFSVEMTVPNGEITSTDLVADQDVTTLTIGISLDDGNAVAYKLAK